MACAGGAHLKTLACGRVPGAGRRKARVTPSPRLVLADRGEGPAVESVGWSKGPDPRSRGVDRDLYRPAPAVAIRGGRWWAAAAEEGQGSEGKQRVNGRGKPHHKQPAWEN